MEPVEVRTHSCDPGYQWRGLLFEVLPIVCYMPFANMGRFSLVSPGRLAIFVGSTRNDRRGSKDCFTGYQCRKGPQHKLLINSFTSPSDVENPSRGHVARRALCRRGEMAELRDL